jgi:hypothetical protein
MQLNNHQWDKSRAKVAANPIEPVGVSQKPHGTRDVLVVHVVEPLVHELTMEQPVKEVPSKVENKQARHVLDDFNMSDKWSIKNFKEPRGNSKHHVRDETSVEHDLAISLDILLYSIDAALNVFLDHVSIRSKHPRKVVCHEKYQKIQKHFFLQSRK